MNDSGPIIARRLLDIEISFSYERTGVARNLNYAGHIYFDGVDVDSHACVGRSTREAEARMRSWCESLTAEKVLEMVSEEVEGEREYLAQEKARLAAREARCEALANKVAAKPVTHSVEIAPFYPL